MTDAVLYETPAPNIARLVLNRPDSRNAQDTSLLYALNAAFDRAAQDDGVKVIILAAAGTHFSSGHDLREGGSIAEQMAGFDPVGTWCGFGCAGAEGRSTRANNPAAFPLGRQTPRKHHSGNPRSRKG